jgi:hypothetical protein
MTGMVVAPLPAKPDPHPLARRKGDLLGIKVSTVDMGSLAAGDRRGGLGPDASG